MLCYTFFLQSKQDWNAHDLLELLHAYYAINFEIGYQSFATTNSSKKKNRINFFIVIDNALHDLNIDNMHTCTIICTKKSLGEKIATPCLPKLNLFMYGFEKVGYNK